MTVTVTEREAEQIAAYMFERACANQGIGLAVAARILTDYAMLLGECGIAAQYVDRAVFATTVEAERVDTLFDLTEALRDETAGIRADIDSALARLVAIRATSGPADEPDVSEPRPLIPDFISDPEPAIEEPAAEWMELCRAPAGTYDGVEGGRPYCPAPCPHGLAVDVAPEAIPLAEPYVAVPAALTVVGDASGAPPVALDGGSEKPAGPVACPVCGKTFARSQELNGHRGAHAPKGTCTVCGRSIPAASMSSHALTGHILTARQQQVLEAVRAAEGIVSKADDALGAKRGLAHSTIAGIREKGLLPADVEALLAKHAYGPRPRREAPTPVPKRPRGGPDAPALRASNGEADGIRALADRIRAREADPPPDIGAEVESFDQRRVRFARERSETERASRVGSRT